MVRCAIWRQCKGRERKGGFVFGTCCGLTANTVSALLELSLLDCQHQVPYYCGYIAVTHDMGSFDTLKKMSEEGARVSNIL